MGVVVASPAFRWAGGKSELLPELRRLMPTKFNRYFEPFIGGGALFWDLAAATDQLREGAVTISDANAAVARTYRALQQDVEGVIRILKAMPATEKDYYAIRGTTSTGRATMQDDELAAWFLYVNKLGFNGVFRVNKKGGFNVPWGRWEEHGRPIPNPCNEELLRACSKVLRDLRVGIGVGDFEVAALEAAKGDLIYFDPPYVPVSATADFTGYTEDGFTHEDQVRLRDVALALKKRGVHIMLSNADVPIVRELYASPEFVLHEVSASRSVNSKATKRGKVGEVIVT